jgi:exodeoxyribonuclease VII large subunit
MDFDLLRKLKEWRIETARREGVDLFRIFQNKTLEDIATIKPTTKGDMLAIKGIRERKFEKYGEQVLALINGNSEPDFEQGEEGKKLYTVSKFLNFLNNNLRVLNARIQGEVSSFDLRGNYLFFSLKDKEDGSVLSCFMWNNDYRLYGIELEEGMEVIIDGFPAVHKPTGKLSMQVSAIELVGEGALKKAYDELKKKLEKDGLFAPECKKAIPALPRKIGLITSETGAVIHDFLNNLGKYGYQIKFVNSRVEGQIAVSDLMSAVDYFSKQDIDVLVIMRGGGSLESLQAFNNEVLVRKIAECRMPVICGIGHDKDVPLASLVADMEVSTPTAVAIYLNRTWDEAVQRLAVLERDILYKYQEILQREKYLLEEMAGRLRKYFGMIFQEFDGIKHRLKSILTDIGYDIKSKVKILDNSFNLIFNNFKRNFQEASNFINETEKKLEIYDPMRQLKLGYSIASIGEKVIKSIKQARVGSQIDIQVSDGKIKSIINKIN